MKYFERKEIHGIEDLPAKAMKLVAHFIHSGRMTDLEYFNNSEDDKYWLSEVDWYLLPCDSKIEALEELCEAYKEYFKMLDSFNVFDDDETNKACELRQRISELEKKIKG